MTDKSGKKLYFFAIIPNAVIENEIVLLKEYMAANYGSKAALKSPPHITLCPPFHFFEQEERKLISTTEEICDHTSAFDIQLVDFNAFFPRVIYVDVISDEHLQTVYYSLNKLLEENLGIVSDLRKGRAFSPHITIAFSDLTKEQFYKAWREFKSKTYRRFFTASSIAMLKHNGKTWDVFYKVPFKNSPLLKI